jgi:hypothetical protein
LRLSVFERRRGCGGGISLLPLIETMAPGGLSSGKATPHLYQNAESKVKML